MPSVLTHPVRVLAAYARHGDDGLDRVADRIEQEAHQRPHGKFSKRTTLYQPQSLFPPLAWRNECERCRFYEDGEPGEPATCHVVGRPDDPFGGEAIHPRGACGYYMAPTGEPAFSWISEQLDPSGASSVRGEYRPPVEAYDVDDDELDEERARDIPVTVPGNDGE